MSPVHSLALLAMPTMVVLLVLLATVSLAHLATATSHARPRLHALLARSDTHSIPTFAFNALHQIAINVQLQHHQHALHARQTTTLTPPTPTLAQLASHLACIAQVH